MIPNQFIIPDWNVPENIKSLVTSRQGGNSIFPYDSFNLATHVGDDSILVEQNRSALSKLLPATPVWLNQVHSDVVVDAADVTGDIDADGSYTTQCNIVSAVMTADCLPVLVCTRQGDAVAALHAGWRGLLNGILEQGITKMLDACKRQPEDCLIWFGPTIGSDNFEVGDEVRQAFIDKSRHRAIVEQYFKAVKGMKGKWLADLVKLAEYRLSQIGVENFSGGDYCTYADKEKFYSYRRDGITGRMASLIWIE
ncbi:MAG: peptidoglycan editing factor PgeF [gamma proteobacterium symbiont of Taylorina sp.]|nr:peptidoglycan editing factor PgeF [gamma proteobacterium symbiont of Taylorina sp.]